MSIHHLKINKQPFDDLVSGRKTGEVRDCSDRDFKVGDSVELFMTETATGLATESIVRTITHIQRGYGLPDDICVLSYAAPVVERQPVGEVVAVVSKGMSGYDGVLYADAIIEGVVEAGTKLYTAPPELAELQATIDELAELLKQAREHVPQAHPLRGLINASLMQHQLERGPKQ